MEIAGPKQISWGEFVVFVGESQNRANLVTAQMKKTFKSILFGLMVGVGEKCLVQRRTSGLGT